MRPPSTVALGHLLAACAAVAALALSACGGGEEGSAIPGKDGGAGTTEATSTAPKAPARGGSDVGDGAKRKAATGSCQAQLGDLLGSLDRLRIRLATGLSYRQYAAAVRRGRAVYGDLDADRLPPDCLIAAGTSAEKSLNRYIEAANSWGECLADAGCNARVVEPELQREWQVASHWLSEAHEGLRRIAQ